MRALTRRTDISPRALRARALKFKALGKNHPTSRGKYVRASPANHESFLQDLRLYLLEHEDTRTQRTPSLTEIAEHIRTVLLPHHQFASMAVHNSTAAKYVKRCGASFIRFVAGDPCRDKALADETLKDLLKFAPHMLKLLVDPNVILIAQDEVAIAVGLNRGGAWQLF